MPAGCSNLKFTMIPVSQAQSIIRSVVRDFGTERITLSDALGRVLMEDWRADRPMPPYDRVTMDGIAVNYDIAVTQEQLKVAGVVAAGDPQAALINPLHCLEVMTGAILPHGTDTVIRYEDVTILRDSAVVNVAYRKGQNVHQQGSDRQEGDLLVSRHTLLGAPEIGVGASIGKYEVIVSRLPKAIIISTGNELVEIHESPLPHQIRRGNVYRLQASLKEIGITAATDHIIDDMTMTQDRLSAHLVNYDLIILSGGVSKGKFDFLPGALEACGVEKLFHKIAQRPGKPLWFGTHPNGATAFALPGNPISSFMCQVIYVLDWIQRCSGAEVSPQVKAQLSEDVSFRPELTYFMQVHVMTDKMGRLIATPRQGNGSGDLANLIEGSAFMQLPSDKEEFKKGECYPIHYYR